MSCKTAYECPITPNGASPSDESGKTVFLTYPAGHDYQVVKAFESHDLRIRGRFLCNNSKCVNYEDLCDHFNDCEDYSDE